MTAPEIRYRRLLALYPRDFRQEYEEEMLGVLMADPRPGPAQAFDVMRGAIAAHLRGLWVGESRAARVVQIFGAMLLFAIALRRVMGGVVRIFLADPAWVHIETVSWVRVAAWGVTVIAAFLGWRVLGAAGALVGLAGEIAAPFQSYLNTPATVLYAYWLIVAAAVVLAAGLVAERGRARPRGWLLVGAAGVVLAGPSSMYPYVLVGQGSVLSYAFGMWWGPILLAPMLLLVAVVRQDPDTRRRLVCWAAPVIATVPLVQWGFGGFMAYNGRHPEDIQLIGPVQWAVLVLVPVVAFVGASVVNRRGAVSRVRPADM